LGPIEAFKGLMGKRAAVLRFNGQSPPPCFRAGELWSFSKSVNFFSCYFFALLKKWR